MISLTLEVETLRAPSIILRVAFSNTPESLESLIVSAISDLFLGL